MLWGQQRRAGALTLAAGVLYGALAFFVIRPIFATHASGLEETTTSYLTYYFGELASARETLIPRILHGLVVFGPVLVMVWRGWPWLLPGLPVAAAALISTGPAAVYAYHYHHYALMVPFIMLALVESLGWLYRRQQTYAADGPPRRPRPRRTWRGELALTLLLTFAMNSIFVDTPLGLTFWQAGPGWGFEPSGYGRISRDAVKDAFLAEHVPPGAPIATNAALGAQISNREVIYEGRQFYRADSPNERFEWMLGEVDYVVSDALYDYFAGIDGAANEQGVIGQVLNHPDFTLVAMRDGLLFFARNAAPGAALAQHIEVEQPAVVSPASVWFGEHIGLVRYAITPLDEEERRYRARFTWRTSSDAAPPYNAVAVSHLEGVPDTRIVHLPTYALYTTPAWEPGQLIHETFEFELPDDLAPGVYTWRTGWYDLTDGFAAYTDERSRLPGSSSVALDRIHVVK
jgi:hypothetical protein